VLSLEDAEDLAAGLGLGFVVDDVEADGLAEGTALTDSDNVADLDLEGGGDVGGDVGVALLETVVLLHVVEVVAADDQGTVHLGADDDTLDDGTTDGDVASEGALVVNVLTLDGRARGLEAKTDVLVVTANGLLLG